MFSNEECRDFLQILASHGTIKRKRLLRKMHTAGNTRITDILLRRLKTYINETNDWVIVGSDNKRGYFLVFTIDRFESGLKQIEKQAYNLLKKRKQFIIKFKRLYPSLYSEMFNQGRLNFNVSEILIPGEIPYAKIYSTTADKEQQTETGSGI